MSFSKAKLKRFNEIQVTDSPYADRAGSERKESIKKLIKELSRDAEHKKTISVKETVASSETDSCKTTGSAEPLVSKAKSCTMRLFRTPSLPKRLRFNRQHSDLTPKEKSSAAKTLLFGAPQSESMGPPPLPMPINTSARDKEALEAANIEIRTKNEVIADYEQQIEELRIALHQSKLFSHVQTTELSEKNQCIVELEHELNDDNEGIEMLKGISQKSIAKIETLEKEIRLILRNHENEIDFLIRSHTHLELDCDRSNTEKKLLNEEVVVLKKQVLHLNDELRQAQCKLVQQTEKLSAQDSAHKRLIGENVRLLEQIAAIKRDADNDMIAYVEESQSVLRQLDWVRAEKSKVDKVLAANEKVIADLRDEVAGKDIEMDGVRDELRDGFNADLQAATKKYEQKIATLRELNEMKIKEIESIFVLERSKTEKSHADEVKQLRGQLERSSDTAEEKIRISEVQLEQRLKAMESTIEQSIEHEKQLWKSEIDKCQKIAETEIMQCEFEKQDLKALLDAANELMREKDDKIEEMQVRLSNEIASFVQCREELAVELSEVRNQCTRAMTDKYNYQLTLNNTRSTVTILMERLTKSDGDVEILKQELEKSNEELAQLHKEAEEYRKALTVLRGSSLALERELHDKDTAFERLMADSEDETLSTVNKFGKLFNDKIEENMGKYAEMYNELKLKYDARENYILDMKALLDEFASGIELARIELDSKDEKLVQLQAENKNIKLENMTYKFKCEQFEKYDPERVAVVATAAAEPSVGKFDSTEEDGMVPELLMADIITQLERDAGMVVGAINMGLYSDEDKIAAENAALKEKLAEKSRQIELLQEIVHLEGGHATENVQLKKQLEELTQAERNVKYADHSAKPPTSRKHIDQLKESNLQLKNKIAQLQMVNTDQEAKIGELKEHLVNERTPIKLNRSINGGGTGTPKTPRTPKKYPGKENHHDMVSVSPNPNALRTRNQ